jgi:hypothetical protein
VLDAESKARLKMEKALDAESEAIASDAEKEVVTPNNKV